MSNKHYARLMWVNASIAVYAVAGVYVTWSGLQKIDDHSKCMYVFLISIFLDPFKPYGIFYSYQADQSVFANLELF